MTRFLVRRLLLTIPVLIGVATLVFSLIHLVPGDPVQAMLGESASPQDVAQLRTKLGLDRPLHRAVRHRSPPASCAATSAPRFAPTSRSRRRSLERMPATIELAIAAMVVAIVIAIPLGIIAAVRAGTRVDHAATTLALVGISMPNFWLGPLLAIVFSVWLGWFPVSGRGTLAQPRAAGDHARRAARGDPRADDARERASRNCASCMCWRRARAACREARAVLRHAFRNSLIPIVTVLGLQFGAVLTGAVITETIFAWPGVGRLLVQSISSRDYPLVQGCILLIAVTYVVDEPAHRSRCTGFSIRGSAMSSTGC